MKNGGKRPGAGRPKGTIGVKARTLLEVKDRIAKNVDSILNTQLVESKGTHLIYRLNPIDRKYVLVTDADEITECINNYRGTDDESLYVITTQKPDTKTGQYLIDRAYGKAPQTIEIMDETSQKWKQAVQDLIDAKAAKDEREAVALLESVGYKAPEPVQSLGDVG